MTEFVDNFPDAELINTLGNGIVYTPLAGSPLTIKAIIEFDVFIDDYHSEKRNEVELLRSAVGGTIQHGDSFVYKSKTYVLDTWLDQDDAYERWGLTDG